ncbi:MAG TPA: hypothetical protein VHE61_08095 [Opitutaceae bacterium]|nr:hypothetical protein [Opitutaceae bacterium]
MSEAGKAVGRACTVICEETYRGELAARHGCVLQESRVTVLLAPAHPDTATPPLPIGAVHFAVFRPRYFPGERLPADLHADIHGPITTAWDLDSDRPAGWLMERHPELRPEFLVLARIEIVTPGRRIGLSVTADIINRHLPPGGVALVNPCPLEFVGLEFQCGRGASEAEIAAGLARLSRHYARLGFQSPDQPGLMTLLRPWRPLVAPPVNLLFTDAELAALRARQK